MAEQSKFEIEIRTKADVQAARLVQRELEAAAKMTKQLGLDSTALDRELERVNKALDSQSAKLAIVAEHQKKAIANIKALGGETKNLEAELKKTLDSLGVKKSPIDDALTKFKNLLGGGQVQAAAKEQQALVKGLEGGFKQAGNAAEKAKKQAEEFHKEAMKGALGKGPVDDALARFKGLMGTGDAQAAAAVQGRLQQAQSKGIEGSFARAAAAAKDAAKATDEFHASSAKALQGASLIDKLNQLKDAYNGAGGGLRGFMAVLTGGGAKAAAAGAAIAGAFFAARKAINEFASAEKEVAGITAALGQTQQLSETNVKAIQEMANELQAMTAIPAGEWLAALTRGLQFGAKVNELDRFSAGVKNLAGLMGGDVQQASTVMARALQGNFEAFSRYGIVVRDAGSETEKLNQLYEDLAMRGGGQLEASAKTITGQFQQFKNAVNDVMQAIGQKIAQTQLLQITLYGLGTTLSWIAGLIGDVLPPLEGFRNAAQSSANSAEEAARSTREFAEAQKHLKEQTNQALTVLEKQLDAIDELQRREDERADLQLGLQLAKIDLWEKQGNITGDQANVLRLSARNAAREDADNRRLRHNQEKLEASKAVVASNNAAMQAADANVTEAEQNAAAQAQRDMAREALRSHYERRVDQAKYNLSTAKPSRFNADTKAAREAVIFAERERDSMLERFDQEHPREALPDIAAAKKEAQEIKDPLFRRNSQEMEAQRQLQRESLDLAGDLQIKRQTHAVQMQTALTPAVSRTEAANAVAQRQQREQELLEIIQILMQDSQKHGADIHLIRQQLGRHRN